jgi:hypothetical protein
VNELRAMFTRMVWVKKISQPPQTTDINEVVMSGYFREGWGWGTTWDVAKANALAAYANCDPLTGYNAGQAYTELFIDSPGRTATVFRSCIDMRCINVPTALSCTVDFYLWAIRCWIEWSAQGDLAKEDLYSLHGSVGPSSDATRTLTIGRAGVGDAPTDWPTIPTGWQVHQSKGYFAKTNAYDTNFIEIALLRFNVAGGLTEY